MYVSVHSKHWSRVFSIEEVNAKSHEKLVFSSNYQYYQNSAVWITSWRMLEGEGERFWEWQVNLLRYVTGSTELLRRYQCLIGTSTEYTQSGNGRFLAYITSWMMEKSAQPVEGGGCTPPPFTLFTIAYKVVVYAPTNRTDTLPLFLLYPYMYSVVVST